MYATFIQNSEGHICAFKKCIPETKIKSVFRSRLFYLEHYCSFRNCLRYFDIEFILMCITVEDLGIDGKI
jgi:hypothetical protein